MHTNTVNAQRHGADDEKLDADRDEIAVIQRRSRRFLRGRQRRVALAVEADEQLTEIDFAEDQPERGHDDVVNQGGDDFAEGCADDHADGEVDGVAFRDEGFEFLPHDAGFSAHRLLP